MLLPGGVIVTLSRSKLALVATPLVILLTAIGATIPFLLGEARLETYLVVVLELLAGSFVIAWLWFWARSDEEKDWIPIVTAAFAALTILYAYVATENANREAAETRIADQGYTLLGYEMSHGELRCIYDWYDSADETACLARALKDRDAWSFVMLYIEETVWLFDASERYRRRYRAEYGDDIAYWRTDAAADPTGLISFYIVSEAQDRVLNGEAGGRTPQETAGCLITQFQVPQMGSTLCSKYHGVRAAAPAGFFTEEPFNWCSPGTTIEPASARCGL